MNNYETRPNSIKYNHIQHVGLYSYLSTLCERDFLRGCQRPPKYFPGKENKLILLLSAFAITSAVLHIRADFKQRWNQTYIFKPLTLAIIILIALFQASEVSIFYKTMIILGLMVSMAGDVFLMKRTDKFIQGLSSFFMAHLLYLAAFISSSGFPTNYYLLIPGLVIALLFLKILLPRAGKMAIPVTFYIIILVMMLWQSSDRMILSYTSSSILAFLGTGFFVFSDATLGINRFVKKSSGGQALVLLTYYTAQLFIAYSV
ncbi:MAG: lysoplasmalogenase [Candidatus Marinimicrobia bacterium]|nr:lysoplasmalogenase [Candidatus Neomarinimicrobiota bacterium]